MKVYKFSECASSEFRTDITFEMIKEKYQRGCFFGLDNLLSIGCYKLGGWCYDFREELKKYVYKQYGQWHEVYAPNKTLLRRATYGRIDKILEVK